MISSSIYYLYNNLLDFLYFSDIMSCSRKNLKLYKTEIISLFQNNNSAVTIATILENKYDFKIKDCTIESHFQQWRIHKQNHITDFNTAFHAQIKILFFEIDLEDDDMLHALQDERFDIIDWNLKDVWHQLDFWCHMNFIEAQQQMNEIIQAIEKELKKETIKKYEKKLLHYYFQNRNFIIAQWIVWLSEAYSNWL